MEKVRFYCAIIADKFVSLGLKVLRKRVPYYRGYIALRICPKFLTYVKKPELIVAVTGTNGKSTLAGLLVDSFENLGYHVMNNQGFNVKDGIASMFLRERGHKNDVAILEVDEQATKSIFQEIVPDYLIVTNIFRDSMRNNSNVEFITEQIRFAIKEKTKVILPADDLLTGSRLQAKNPIYYHLEYKKMAHKKPYNLVNDLIYCPNCGDKLTIDSIYYHHIGTSHCESCGYQNPEAKYTGIFQESKKEIQVEDVIVPVKDTSLFNLYNLLPVIVLLKELKIPDQKIISALKNYQIIDSRYQKEIYHGISIFNMLVKGQNPVASSSVFYYVKKAPGEKAILLLLDDLLDNKLSSETIAWYYDTDFEFLNDPHIKQIVIGGKRCHDLYVRLLLAGIPKEKIKLEEDEFTSYKKIQKKGIDSVYILRDLWLFEQSLQIKELLKEEIL